MDRRAKEKGSRTDKTLRLLFYATAVFLLTHGPSIVIAKPIAVIEMRDGNQEHHLPKQLELIGILSAHPDAAPLPAEIQSALLGQHPDFALAVTSLENAKYAARAGIAERALEQSATAERLWTNQVIEDASLKSFVDDCLLIQFEQSVKANRLLVASRAHQLLGNSAPAFSAVDAVNVPIIASEVSVTPKDSQLWLDRTTVTGTTITASYPGVQIVTATHPGFFATSRTLAGNALTLTLRPDAHAALRRAVREVQGRKPTPAMVFRLLEQVDSGIALILTNAPGYQVWVRLGDTARHAGTSSSAKAAIELATRQTPRERQGHLLVENRDGQKNKAKAGRRWWVYGIAIGAAVVGGAVIVASQR